MVTEVKLPHKELDEDQYAPLGGQAVIEGVMMRGLDMVAVAVRQETGGIAMNEEPFTSLTRRHKLLGLPFIRGAVSLVESLRLGIHALNFSARAAFEEEEEEVSSMESALSLIIGLGIAIALFMVMPGFIFVYLQKYIQNTILLNLIEGGLRASIFIGYIVLISLSKDVRRLFEYHGAEHKTIFAYEAGDELTIENARKYTTLHPRCGTSFIVITMLISILLFSLLGRSPDVLTRVLSKLSLLPFVAGLSFELIRLSGQIKEKPTHWLVRFAYLFTIPGLWLQKLTTREPSDDQLEIAIAALKKVLGESAETVKTGESVTVIP